jgi:hypothetical protein
MVSHKQNIVIFLVYLWYWYIYMYLCVYNSSYIIGTINQSNVTSLNLHQNFKWVLCVNHTEPVKNYLIRLLERRLVDYEMRLNQQRAPTSGDLEEIINWIPRLWLQVNKYIELYNSVDLTLGPRMFATFPFDYKQAFHWFVDLWNNKLVPLLIDIIREGVQAYGAKLTWEEPKLWLEKNLPWSRYDANAAANFYSIQGCDVGFVDCGGTNSSSNSSVDEIESSSGSSGCDTSQQQQAFKERDDHHQINDQISLERMRIQSFMSSYSNSHQTNGLNAAAATPATKTLCQNSHENDKLLNMLMRLQEATGLNGAINLENDLMIQSATSKTNNVHTLMSCQQSLESSL